MITAETKIEFPVSLDTLTKILDTDNIGYTYIVKEIFNVISYSVEPRWKANIEDSSCPYSELRVLKIWYIADAWQELVVGGHSPQSIGLSMVIHKMAGCKESANLLKSCRFR